MLLPEPLDFPASHIYIADGEALPNQINRRAVARPFLLEETT
jgi:hypothetical protein